MSCEYQSRERDRGPFTCELGFFDGKPYLGNCNECQSKGWNVAKEIPPQEKVLRVSKAIYRWALSGFPVNEREESDRRIAICRACKFWKENGNLNLGECTHPSCGCTKYKTIFATEKCPIGKWLITEGK